MLETAPFFTDIASPPRGRVQRALAETFGRKESCGPRALAADGERGTVLLFPPHEYVKKYAMTQALFAKKGLGRHCDDWQGNRSVDRLIPDRNYRPRRCFL